MKFILYTLFLSVVSFLFLGYLNAYHPLLDSLSHFRIQLAYLSAITLLPLIFVHRGYYRYFLIFSLLILSVYIYSITQPYPNTMFYKTVPKKGTHITHMQFNMNYRNTKFKEIEHFLETNKPDIVTLQEVTTNHQNKLSMLKKLYPYQRYCAFYPVVGGVAILSRYPFATEEYNCVKGKGLLISDIIIEDKILTVASLHLHWPFPYNQYTQVLSLMPALEKIKGNALVSGDFNAATWSHIVAIIAKASHTKVTKGLRWSIELEHQLPLIPYFKLPIDQVLLSKGLSMKYIHPEKHLGSDHYPIMSVIKMDKNIK